MNDFVLGSIMSAVHVYGVRLVVVLGHTRCGMVARAIQHWAKHEHKKAQEGLSSASVQARAYRASVGPLISTSVLLALMHLPIPELGARKHAVMHVLFVRRC